MSAGWDAPALLAALLDGLETALLAAPDAEVLAAEGETNRARGAAAAEVARLLVPDPLGGPGPSGPPPDVVPPFMLPRRR